MKKILNALVLSSSLLVSSLANSAPLEIYQGFKSSYGQKPIADAHAFLVLRELEERLEPFHCEKLDYELRVLRATQTRIFRSDVLGELETRIETTCHSDDLIGFRFQMELGGYDEDYTLLAYEITTRSKGKRVKYFCAYGLHDGIYECPAQLQPGRTWSTPLED